MILDKHEDADLFHRLTLIEKDFPGAAVLLHKSGVLPKVTEEWRRQWYAFLFTDNHDMLFYKRMIRLRCFGLSY